MPRLAIFFISSGRSGTQWLCNLIQDQFADLCVATHETLQADYNIRKFLGNSGALTAATERMSIDRHIDFIHSIDDSTAYVETGWTSAGVLPYMAEVLGDRFRVVQLTRHPVESALSLSCQGMHQPDSNDSSENWSFLDPFIEGSTCDELQPRWSAMTAYEKCLYQWYEIHRFGEQFLSELPTDRTLRVQFESMTNPDSGTLKDVLSFCGIDRIPDLKKKQEKRVDRYPSVIPFTDDWRTVYSYPKLIDLTKRLDYSFDEQRLDDRAQHHGKRERKAVKKVLNKVKRHYRKYVLQLSVK